MWDRSSALITVTLALLFAFPLSLPAAGTRVIVYPKPVSDKDKRINFPVTLLQLALEKSTNSYQLQARKQVTLQARALEELKKKQGIDVVWSMTSIQREQELLPIRIPIYKGLIGWRLLLIHQSNLDFFRSLTELEQLADKTAGQGHDWPDTTILQANGLRVHAASSYEGLFKMLAIDRINYFPRSIIEIWEEYLAHKDKGIVICPGVILQYPTAFYYFVNKDNQQLAVDIENGLEKAIADGSFDALLQERYGKFFKKTDLSQRTVFPLHNPLLPAETPLDRPELWYHH